MGTELAVIGNNQPANARLFLGKLIKMDKNYVLTLTGLHVCSFVRISILILPKGDSRMSKRVHKNKNLQ